MFQHKPSLRDNELDEILDDVKFDKENNEYNKLNILHAIVVDEWKSNY